MDIVDVLILLAAGVFAGFVNTVAGGGSLVTLPVMIFIGLPPAVANGTNRIAVLLQNIFGTAGFRSKGVSMWPFAGYLGLSAFVGAIIGAKISVDLDGQTFSRILAVVMISVIIITVFNPSNKTIGGKERMDRKHQIISTVVFFFVGIYGGFIQAGVGFVIIAALSGVNRLSLIKVNATKVLVVLIYTIASLAVFILEDKINYTMGFTLAAGNSTGAWIGSRWQVDKGDKWVKRILVVTVIGLALKLWFYG